MRGRFTLTSRTMPSSKGKPTDPKLRENMKEEIKNETNKDGGGKGQWSAWKASVSGFDSNREAVHGQYVVERGQGATRDILHSVMTYSNCRDRLLSCLKNTKDGVDLMRTKQARRTSPRRALRSPNPAQRRRQKQTIRFQQAKIKGIMKTTTSQRRTQEKKQV